MEEAGFVRTPEQIRVRWKNVKKAYLGAKQNNGTSGRPPASCPFYDLLDDLLGSRPLSQAGQKSQAGVDVGFEPSATETTMETVDPEEDKTFLESLQMPEVSPGSSPSSESSGMRSGTSTPLPAINSSVDLPGEMLGMSISSIMPVKNYSSELDLDSHKDILLLSAVDNIQEYANLYFQDQASKDLGPRGNTPTREFIS
ncbi:unnamed protein product [Merluccius merluccius]